LLADVLLADTSQILGGRHVGVLEMVTPLSAPLLLLLLASASPPV